MRAEIIAIGTELLLGQIVDTNSAWLAARLADLGIDCHWVSTVGDNLGRATEAVSRALGRSELVVCTGGLGPTEDDLTREAIAAAVGEAPAVDPTLETELRAWFASRGLDMPERNRKQAWLIPSARALPNPNGTAPGWLVERAGRTVVAMPGVPREMMPMWEREVEPRLRAPVAPGGTLVAPGGTLVAPGGTLVAPSGTRARIRSRTLKLLGVGESAVEEALGDLVRSTAPTVATYAKSDGVHIRITDRDADGAVPDERIAAMERTIRGRLGWHVWGADGDTLGGVVGAGLRARGWRLASAEGLTGGELARLLTEADVDGWYAGGAVLPGAGPDRLFAAAAEHGADAVVITAAGDEALVAVRTPDRERRATVRYGSSAEARRRATLAALDLLRRSL